MTARGAPEPRVRGKPAASARGRRIKNRESTEEYPLPLGTIPNGRGGSEWETPAAAEPEPGRRREERGPCRFSEAGSDP